MNTPLFPPAAGRKLVFLHLPKTGGTTLHHHFSEAFAPEEICPERFPLLDRMPPETLTTYRYFSGHFNFEQVRLIPGRTFVVTVLRDPAERILSTYYFWKRHRPEVVLEHRLVGPAAAQATDLLGFLRSTVPGVRDAIENTMARYLAGGVHIDADGRHMFPNGGQWVPIGELEIMHRATGNLSAVDVFGFTSHLAEVYAKVSVVFGMKRVRHLAKLNTRDGESHMLGPPIAEEEITADIRAEIDRLTMMDRILYRLSRAHWRAARGG